MTRAVGVGVFVGIALAGIALDRLGRGRTVPSLAQALGWLDTRPTGRVVLFAAWGYTGWHFFVR